MMTSLFQYSLGVSIPLLVIWALYRLLLSRQKRLSLNRIMLLVTYAVSLALPPLLTWLHPITSIVYISGGGDPTDAPGLDWMGILSCVWLAGAVSALTLTLLEAGRILLMVRRCEKRDVDGRTVHITDLDSQSPFSLGRCIVMNRSDFEESCCGILLHEEGHIRLRHSWDMVLAQMVTVLCWYNPAAWLMRADLKSVHEFQADDYAVRHGLDAADYQSLLVRKAAGVRFPFIGNNFRSGNLGKRIAMMNRPEEPRAIGRLSYLAPVAGAVLAVLIMTIPEVRGAIVPRRVAEAAGVGQEAPKKYDFEIFVDDREVPEEDLHSIRPEDIKSITVYKDEKGNRIHVETKK